MLNYSSRELIDRAEAFLHAADAKVRLVLINQNEINRLLAFEAGGSPRRLPEPRTGRRG